MNVRCSLGMMGFCFLILWPKLGIYMGVLALASRREGPPEVRGREDPGSTVAIFDSLGISIDG